LGGGSILCANPKINPDPTNGIVGVAGRVATELIKPDDGVFNELVDFADKVISTHPILSAPIEMPSAYDIQLWWLENTSYEKWRKEDLTKVWENFNVGEELDQISHNLCFIKDEVYTDWKLARAIFSRTDLFKLIFGPLTKLIEKQVYQMDEFIKNIPFIDRANYVFDRLGGRHHVTWSNDYTAYESLFSDKLMRAVECKLYSQKLGRQFPQLVERINDVLTGTNKLRFKTFTASINARRMSGEMSTSLGNGITNLIINWFVLHKAGYSIDHLFTNCMTIVEGDDSLTISEKPVDFLLYRELGMRAKLQTHEKIGEASFCGMFFDDDDKTIICDIRKQIVGLSWGDAKWANARKAKHHSLLRAKAMCLAYQYRGCPILDKLCHRMLYLTASCDPRHMLKMMSRDYYHSSIVAETKQCINNIIADGPKEPTLAARLFVEKHLNISMQMQVLLERRVDSFTLGHNDLITMICSDAQLEYAQKFVGPLMPNLMKGSGPRLSEEQIGIVQNAFLKPQDFIRFQKSARGQLDGD